MANGTNNAFHLGFREVVTDHSSFVQWTQITIDTGASLSTLQDIKVPEYSGSYVYKNQSHNTQNRFIFWRVCHDVVEIWEDSLDVDLQSNHLMLRFTDTPVLEGLSVHENNLHVVILLVTVASIHRIKLPHPFSSSDDQSNFSVFKDLNSHSIRDFHSHYVFNTNSAVGEALPHTAGTHLSTGISSGDALFVLGQTGGSLIVATMTNLTGSVHVNCIKRASLINRFFTGIVPTMFKGVEGGETVSSLTLESFKGEVMAFGVCFDSRIRVWSCSKLECILAHNALENTAETGKKLGHGDQRHLIRSVSNGGIVYLAVYLSFEEKNLILIFTPEYQHGRLTLQLNKTLYPPQYDLIDLSVTSTFIWSLWTDSKNEVKLLYSSTSFNGNNVINSPGLKEAYLEPLPEKEVALDPSIDAAEVYLQEILKPYRFSAYTLNKALGIYRRNIDATLTGTRSTQEGSPKTELRLLADEVEKILKEEIENFRTTESTIEEMETIKLETWANFYSHALQYHQVSRKAVGLVNVGGDGLVAIMRKQSVSWMRPLDALELLILGNASSAASVAALASTPVLNEDCSVAAAVVAIARPLNTIKKVLCPEVVTAFEIDLHHGEMPEQVAASVAASLLSVSVNEGSEIDEPLSTIIMNQMNGVPGVISGFQAYLRALELDLGNPDALTLDFDNHSNQLSSGSFSSRLGSSIIGAVVAQLAQHRLFICRDLLLLQQVLIQLNVLSPDTKNKVYTTILPQTTRLTQAYYALSRLSFASASVPTPFNLEASRRQMAALSLNDATPIRLPLLSQFPSTALELFILSSGGGHARALVKSTVEEDTNGMPWSQLLMPLATTVAQLTWPVSKCLLFVEFLVWGNQHQSAQEYIRLLQPWCEWNSCSRKFLLGISLLNEGGARKAYNMFLTASEGVATEDFLAKIAGRSVETLEEAQVQYCLKVIRLLDQNGHISLALEMANAGITLAGVDDPGLAALYSVSFKYHLELEHHDEAFTSLMACPDPHRRRNSLRQLIITLYDRKCLSALVSYNYGTLEPDVISILENRARSADILAANYYDLLFAFHVSKHNYKKGAWAMYECALRLNKEGLGEKGLHQQAKCLLACINCLRHIPPDQAWIIKPISKGKRDNQQEKMEDDEDEGEVSSKKKLRHILRKKKPSQIQVLEVSDLELEFELVHARLKLFKSHPTTCSQLPGGPMGASDTVSLLTHGKLFKDAVNICRLFNLPSEGVFEGLTIACVNADASEDKAGQWKWLTENGILRDSCEGAAWWTLLRQLLEENEKGLQSHLHKTVTGILLQRKHTVPAWLQDSYKKRNCGELIWLYLGEGFVEEATNLSVALFDAYLGVGTKQMGLEHALHVNAPAVWLPYNAIDHVLLELEDLRLEQSHFEKMYDTLSEKIGKYQTELQRVSYDRLNSLGS